MKMEKAPMMQRLLRSRAEGQSIIVAALAMVVLVALAGLAVDGSRAFEERRRAATAADAAALSATRALSEVRRNGGFGSSIRAAVQAALADHDLDDAQALSWEARYTDLEGNVLGTVSTGSVPSEPRGVRVELGYEFNTFLMPVLGRDTLPAVADATAVYGPIAGPPFGGDLLPFSFSLGVAFDIQRNAGTAAVFSNDNGIYGVAGGNFGGVDLTPNIDSPNGTGNQADCEDGPVDSTTDAPRNMSYWMCNGTPFDVNIGDTLYGNPGIFANSLADALEHRIDTRPAGLVPVFDYWNGDNGANAEYRIVGFMAVELTDNYQLTGAAADRFIEAEYVNFYVTAGAINPNPDALDTGVYAINLID